MFDPESLGSVDRRWRDIGPLRIGPLRQVLIGDSARSCVVEGGNCEGVDRINRKRRDPADWNLPRSVIAGLGDGLSDVVIDIVDPVRLQHDVLRAVQWHCMADCGSGKADQGSKWVAKENPKRREWWRRRWRLSLARWSK